MIDSLVYLNIFSNIYQPTYTKYHHHPLFFLLRFKNLPNHELRSTLPYPPPPPLLPRLLPAISRSYLPGKSRKPKPRQKSSLRKAAMLLIKKSPHKKRKFKQNRRNRKKRLSLGLRKMRNQTRQWRW